MRRFVLVLVGLVLVPSAAAARSGAHATLSLAVSSHKVFYGHQTVLSGRLSGDLIAGRTVVIEARPYGSSAPFRVVSVLTGVDGRWSHRVEPTIQTIYQAHVARGTIRSTRVTVGVAPAIRVGELATGRLRVQVRAARSFARRLIELQRRVAGGGWQTVERTRLSTASIAVLAPRLPSATVRFALSVNQAGAGYLGASSHPLAFHSRTLTLRPSAFKVLFGHRITLAGRLLNGHAGERIAIFARPYGRRAARRIGTVRTGREGRYRLSVRPAIQTTYQARLAGTWLSRAVTVGVRPALTIRPAVAGEIRARVAAGSKLRGRMIELQRLTGVNSWQTVEKRPLGGNSTALFRFAPSQATIRVAMSVNQAGAGYLGTSSHPLRYRAR